MYTHLITSISICRLCIDSDREVSSDDGVVEVETDSGSIATSVYSDSEISANDEHGVDSDVDCDSLVFPVSIEAADDVCIKLDQLVRNGTISRDDIFYKHIKDVVYCFINQRSHQYDDEVIKFFNTIRYLGGESTANFLRGPAWHGQGRKGKGHFASETKRGNLHCPSSATCAKRQAGYTIRSGVLRDLVTTAIKLADKSTSVRLLVDTLVAKVFPVAIANDGTALKPGLRLDERMKRVVGLNIDVDLAFVLENPNPTSVFLKQAVVTEASVSFLTTLDNEIAMPCSVEYMSKSGKTGEYMTGKFKSETKKVQICQECLSQANIVEHIIDVDQPVCDCFCNKCWETKVVCDDCRTKGQLSYFPACRACTKCLEKGQKCVKLAVFVYTSDCEEGNKKALEQINNQLEDGTIEPELALMVGLPDAIHVGKSLKCSFANWYILLDGQRSNLAMLRTLRDDSDPETRKSFRKLLKDGEAVRNKDRMAVDPILDLTAENFVHAVQNVELVVHALVPERFKFTEDNKVGSYPHPVSIANADGGILFMLDFSPLNSQSMLVKLQLHNPVRLTVCREKLTNAKSLCVSNGLVYVCSADGIVVVEHTNTVSIKIQSFRKDFIAQLTMRGIDATGNVRELKSKMNVAIEKLRAEYASVKKRTDIVHLNVDIHSVGSICSGSDDILFVSSDVERKIYLLLKKMVLVCLAM